MVNVPACTLFAAGAERVMPVVQRKHRPPARDGLEFVEQGTAILRPNAVCAAGPWPAFGIRMQTLANVDVLRGCANLGTLNLAFNKLKGLGALSGLFALRTLNISHNQVPTPGRVTDAHHGHAGRRCTQVTNLKPLGELQQLWQLRCS